MAEPEAENEPTIVERWLEDQQQWQRTVLAYLDAMTKNDDFLVHLGNAMRGSLLAGKPYPAAPAPTGTASAPEAPPDERIDKVLFALHQLEGQLADVQLTLEEIRGGRARSAAAPSIASLKRTRARVKQAAKVPAARASKARTPPKARKRKGRA